MIHSARSLVIVLMAGLLAGCASPTPTAAPTVAPTATLAPTATPAPTLQPGDSERTVTVDGVERSYLLYIPPGIDSLQPVPVVFAFHGAGQEPATMQILTELDDVANSGKFVLVYPEGIGLEWNAGGTCCGYALEKNVDEVAFIREMLSDLETIAQIDTKRIYATGFSNGAALVDHLACEMSDVFAAVASVAGILAYGPCQPQQPISVLHVHGLADLVLPYEGGGEFKIWPVEEIMSSWAAHNGCTGTPIVDNPIKIIKHTVYSSCQAGTAVELYAVEGGGHAWISKYVYPLSEVIWDFFAAYPKP